MPHGTLRYPKGSIMRILIAGGSGFLGSALARSLAATGHEIHILTRRVPRKSREIQWDGRSLGAWAQRIDQMDAIVNATGYGLEHWPWTASRKRLFLDSRVAPGTILAAAVKAARHRPRVFLQMSGINRYGLRGEGIADESTPAADDFLAQLTVQWEAATQPLEDVGVRWIVTRNAVVLDSHAGLFPLMALPVRMFVGGPLGDGQQAVPWIHIEDEVAALQFLLENENASGAFNLIAPQQTSNADFMRAVARRLHRPYWLRTPATLLRLGLGEMSVLVLEGRYSYPRHLEDLGYKFRYPALDSALSHLFPWSLMPS
jgi:uncharacterized protein